MKPRVLFVGRDALPAAARREPRAQVGRALRAARPARARERHRHRPALPARPAAAARRAALLRVAAVARRARAARVPRPTSSSPRARTRRSRSSVARGVARSPAKLVVEVHGDWHTSTRLYGSPRRARCSAARRPARAAGRSAAPTRMRAVSRVHRRRSCAPTAASRSAVHDLLRPRRLRRRRRCPCPRSRASLFVGVLERYKNVEGSRPPGGSSRARAAGGAAAPDRRRGAAGRGRREPRPRSAVEWDAAARRRRGRRGARRARRASCSRRARRACRASRSRRSCRGRAVVAARAGGIPDIVEDGVNGLLVEPGDGDGARRRDRADPHRPRAGRPARRDGARRRPRAGSRRPPSTPTTCARSSTTCSPPSGGAPTS